MKAVIYGDKIKIVGEEGGKIVVLEAEEAIKLAHDILDKADKVLKKTGEMSEP